MKRWLIFGALGCMFSFGAMASTMTCQNVLSLAPNGGTAGHLDALIAAGSCYSLDMLFSGFVYTPGAGDTVGANEISAAAVAVNGSTVVTGFHYSPDGGLTGSFDLGFTATLCNAGGPCVPPPSSSSIIFKAQSQQNQVDGVESMTNTWTPSVGNTLVFNTNSGNTTVGGFFSTTLKIGDSVTVDSHFGGPGTITSVEDDLFAQVVPEPATMLLIGGALLVAGLNIKKFRRR